MPEAIAKLKYLRTSPRKVRLVINLIRGKSLKEAEKRLEFTPKRASLPVLKLLHSAAANAKSNYNTKPTDLFISKITVDGGPTLKRWRARAMGRAAAIGKRTSHITVVLENRQPSPTPNKEKSESQKIEKKEDFKKTKEFKPRIERKFISARRAEVKRSARKIFRRKSI